jgi:MoxR-like ATPase
MDEEIQIVKRTTADLEPQLEVVLNASEILALQKMVRRVPCSDYMISYAVRLVRNSRPTEPGAFDFIKNWVDWGAGPRASQYLILGGKARAILRGRYAVATEDIQAIAPSVLRHRIVKQKPKGFLH